MIKAWGTLSPSSDVSYKGNKYDKEKESEKNEKIYNKEVSKKIKGRHPSNKNKESKIKKLIKLAKVKNASSSKIQNDGMRK